MRGVAVQEAIGRLSDNAARELRRPPWDGASETLTSEDIFQRTVELNLCPVLATRAAKGNEDLNNETDWSDL